jgi:hypothetical protein
MQGLSVEFVREDLGGIGLNLDTYGRKHHFYPSDRHPSRLPICMTDYYAPFPTEQKHKEKDNVERGGGYQHPHTTLFSFQ